MTRYSSAWNSESNPKYVASEKRLGISLATQNPTPIKIPRVNRVTSSIGVTLTFDGGAVGGVVESVSVAVDMVLLFGEFPGVPLRSLSLSSTGKRQRNGEQEASAQEETRL